MIDSIIPPQQPPPLLQQPCRYKCGKIIFWDNSVKYSKVKFREMDTGLLHDYYRCDELILLKAQGKDMGVLEKKK